MSTPILSAITLALVGSFFATSSVYASQLEGLQQALANGETDLKLRYRYERVDQDDFDKDANASTLLTRITYTSDSYKGFFTQVEFDDVTAIGSQNYNSTVNGHTQYPVVADPVGTEVNQALVGYKTQTVTFSAGRQRIVHNDQRFVGGVAWRQNEQTYDGYRLQYDNQSNFSMDYSYVYNVNRIFGEDSSVGDLSGSLHLLNSSFKPAAKHKFAAYAYELDFDAAHALSTRTLGVSYDGDIAFLKAHAAYAVQTEAGENPADFTADYFALELGTQVTVLNVAVGYESLGSDNGKGFSTPLATLHKFQGFTDKFLVTPDQGVNDWYVSAAGKFNKLSIVTSWHQLKSDEGNIDYGSELNVTVKYPLAENIGLLVKYADYRADDYATDTSKFWGMVTLAF